MGDLEPLFLLVPLGRLTVVRTCFGLADFCFLACVFLGGGEDCAEAGSMAHRVIDNAAKIKIRRGSWVLLCQSDKFGTTGLSNTRKALNQSPEFEY